jgi:hypothetical protein
VNRVGGAWSAPVALATGTVLHPMLAFDTAGVLHLSWLNDVSGAPAIMYANRSAAGVWSAPETVAGGDVLSNINADQGPSIAVDAANHPYVLYVSASKGTFGPAGDTAQYGAIRIKERVGGAWTSNDPSPDALTHTPQIYMHGNDIYAFNGHDTAINFAYSYRLAGLAWTPEQKLTTLVADGSANIRWDPLHENDPSIIDAAFYHEDRLNNRSFLGEIYYRAVAPSTAPPADTTPPSVAITSPSAGIVSGTVTLTAGASDNVGVASVQFNLDGSALGGLLTSVPYSDSWNTTSVTNGTHSLSATARDAAGNTTTSTVTVDVENAVAPPPPPTPTTLFGDSTILTHLDNNVAGDVEAFAVNATSSGSLAHLAVYLDAPLPSSLAVGLYSDSGTAPATLLASKSLSTLAAGWNSFDLGPVALTAGARYWVALLVPSGAAGVVNFRDGHSGPSVWYGGHSLSALPGVWPGGSTANDGPVSSYGTS